MKNNTINENAYYIIFNEYDILFNNSENDFPFLIGSEVENLGVEVTNVVYLGSFNDKDCYAIGINTKEIDNGYHLQHFSEIYGKVDDHMFMLIIRGLHLLNWIKTNKFCSCCGEKIAIEGKNTFMECKNCGQVFYPKITPAIIVAVIKDDKILLARSPHFKPNDMYSLLAGHVDSGEFIETCVRREVKEEVGIEIKNIKYFGSHPWPFPDKLMFGFIAEYASGELKIDNDEIEAADWFSLDELPRIPEYKLSFARKMIEWVKNNR